MSSGFLNIFRPRHKLVIYFLVLESQLVKTHTLETIFGQNTQFKNPDPVMMVKSQLNHGTEMTDSAQVLTPNSCPPFGGVNNKRKDKVFHAQ